MESLQNLLIYYSWISYSPEEGVPPEKLTPLKLCTSFREKSILRIILLRKLYRIKSLFEGYTNDDEEDEALAWIMSVKTAEDLIFLINQLTWDALDDDLEEADLTDIACRLSQLLDLQDHFGVSSILRRLFRDPSLLRDRTPQDVAIEFTNMFSALSPANRRALIDELLASRNKLLDDTAILALRKKETNARDFKLIVEIIPTLESYQTNEVTQLDWEVFYTNDICFHLERGETAPIFRQLPDLVNPELSDTRRNAFLLALRKRDPEFRASEEIVKSLGTVSQKSDMVRFIEARKVFMDNFPRLAPPTTLLQRIANQLGLTTLVNSFEDFSKGVNNLPQAIAQAIPADILFNGKADDDARDATNALASISTDRGSLLAFLPFMYKIHLIDPMLKGFTDDDDEQVYPENIENIQEPISCRILSIGLRSRLGRTRF